MVVRVEASIMEQEKSAGLREPAVPRDHLLPPVKRFRRIERNRVERSFEIAHLISEACYLGNGYWDDFGEHWRSPVRSTSNRVIGYIRGFRTLGKDIYRVRALEGLDYLLTEQREDASYPWYYRSHNGVCNRWDGLFDTGIAGRAFVDAYITFGDSRYLEASERIALWEMESPVSDNNNYNMFAVWHLAAHYALTGDQRCLESAIQKTRDGGFPNQLPSGGWPGHNSWLWYHGIIVRGMVELYKVLPDRHPFRDELYGPMTAAVNRAVREQLPTGEVPPNPGIKRRRHTCPFIVEALIMARSIYGAVLDPMISGIMRYRLEHELTEPEIAELAELRKQHIETCTLATAARKSDGDLWTADLTKYRTDGDWGEMPEGAFNCWYPMHEPKPGEIRWAQTPSGPKITARGENFLGGIGFEVPAGTLEPGRRYMFTVKAKAEASDGAKDTIRLFHTSAYSGPKRQSWDPFSDCEFSRENASYDDFSEVSVPFTASNDRTLVYFWITTGSITPGNHVSVIINDARIYDLGLPLPRWRSNVRDEEPHLALEVNATYLEEMP